MSRNRPVSIFATTKYSHKSVTITNASKVVTVMICTIVNICVELHGSGGRGLSLSILDMRYFGSIVKLVMDRMPPNMRDSLAFSNDSMNSVKLLLCTTHTTGTMVISEATFVNVKAFWRNQINAVEWTLAVSPGETPSVFDSSTTCVLRSVRLPMLGNNHIYYINCSVIQHYNYSTYQRLYQISPKRYVALIKAIVDEVCDSHSTHGMSAKPVFDTV